MASEWSAGKLVDQRAFDVVRSGFPDRFVGLLILPLVSCAGIGVLLAVASWGSRAPRETFLRFHAGVVLAWWALNTKAQRFLVGAPKVPWLQLAGLIGTSRSACDVLVHVASIVLLVVIALRLTRRSWPVHALAACLLYLAVFDALFVGDFFIAPVVLLLFWACLPTAKGGLAGLQLQMVFLMSGSGLSKVGPHFGGPTSAHVAFLLAHFAPPWVTSLWWRGPQDLRPSSLAMVVGAMANAAEIAMPLLLFSSSRTKIKLAILGLAVMHTVMAVCTVMLTFLEMWCVMMWCYLFLGGDRDGPRHGFDYAGLRAMPRPVKMCMFAFFALNLCGQVQPSMDWHPFFKYAHFASGNQPCDNPVLLRWSAVEKLLRAQLIADPAGLLSESGHVDSRIAGRWFLELNTKPSAALVDCAFHVGGGGNASDYFVSMSESFVPRVAGGQSSSMNNYNLHLFRALAERGALDAGDVMQVWMEPVAWPQLPLGNQAMAWSIWDAQEGLLKAGELTAAQLRAIRLPSHAAEFLPPECRGLASASA